LVLSCVVTAMAAMAVRKAVAMKVIAILVMAAL
jgi:hypothetical protein